MTDALRIDAAEFRAPRFWLTWLLWKGMRVTHGLPLRWHRRIGTVVGTMLRILFARQRRIARINLRLCFPELSAQERERLLRRHFAALGMSFLEMGIAWFSPIERIRKLIDVHGFENLELAVRSERPVLLWGAHFTCLEIGVRLLEDLDSRCATMHRQQRNALLDKMIEVGRSRFADEQIPRDSIRRLLTCLKDGYTVVYFPDQTHVGNQSRIIPFFGEPAATNTAASRIATRADAIILTYFYRRLPDDRGYRLDIGPPLEGVPSDDPVHDARVLFAALENYIRAAPEQYLWTYKKFKNRPPPYSDPYRDTTDS
ncbi:MAG TPA: lipid A biosynthesis lauroyl acyltransferase [Gammaproteobacteria bacterium]|nr:lipid A biosynthesis lauroyl acyltransferase [Gammaproteobacteria bacterium]